MIFLIPQLCDRIFGVENQCCYLINFIVTKMPLTDGLLICLISFFLLLHRSDLSLHCIAHFLCFSKSLPKYSVSLDIFFLFSSTTWTPKANEHKIVFEILLIFTCNNMILLIWIKLLSSVIIFLLLLGRQKTEWVMYGCLFLLYSKREFYFPRKRANWISRNNRKLILSKKKIYSVDKINHF